MSDATGAHDAATLDRKVRIYVYDRLMRAGQMPLAADVSGELGLSAGEVRASFGRLKEGHILVLQERDEEILMANPFSAVPTPFLVEVGSRSWWGNCIWDAMGIAAMVGEDARISTGCGTKLQPPTRHSCGIGLGLLEDLSEIAEYLRAAGDGRIERASLEMVMVA